MQSHPELMGLPSVGQLKALGGPFKSLPTPTGSRPGLPLCKQASCPCITRLHKEAGDRLLHPAATCGGPSVGLVPGLGCPAWATQGYACFEGLWVGSGLGDVPWLSDGRNGRLLSLQVDGGCSHCSEGETEAQRGPASSLTQHSPEQKAEAVQLG